MVAGALAGATAVLVRNPHVPGSWGLCPFLALTGLPCPFCGGLRAVHDLLDGDVGASLGSNAMVTVGLAAALLLLVRTGVGARRRGRSPAPLVTPLLLLVTLAAVAVFGVLRWVPALAWLAP